MKSLFCHFDLQMPIGGGRLERAAVLFTPMRTINTRIAAEELKRIFADAYAPNRTIFIGLRDSQDALKALISSDELNHVHLPIESAKIRLYVFGEDGRLAVADGTESRIGQNEEEAIRRQGMTAILQRHGGVMHAGASYHYVKPSGGHSVRFLRPGNVLRHGAEVAFIAAWLLRFFKRHTPAIYTDTASIAQVGYSAVMMAKRLGICEAEPTIQSFGSYGGLESRAAFAPELDALILISASTSGNLKERMAKLGADPSNVLTLFSSSGVKEALCDLLKDSIANPQGIDKIETWTKTECAECAAGSLAITIAGDSFLPETPEPRLKLIKRTDQPKWHNKVIKAFEKKNIARCFRPAADGGGPDYPLFCDLSSLCRNDLYSKHFEVPLSRLLTLGTDVIIHLPDIASKKLANTARTQFKTLTSAVPEIFVADNKLDQNLETLQIKKKRMLSVVVIASCVAGGFTLLSVSRSLRNLANRIGYFVAFAVPPSDEAWSQMRSNLELRNDGHGKNPVEVVWLGSLPQLGVGQTSSWKLERDWLQEYKDHLNAPELIQRLSLLDNCQSGRKNGLINNAFLVTSKGAELSLAQNFAFHKCDKKTLTQADVFLVISSMLHHLRSPIHKDGLRQSLNSHVLLSPGNFDRYNDGVVQAAILRSAFSSELAYATDPLASRSMADLVVRMIRLRDETEGAALPEFLMAIATSRMSLSKSDLASVAKELKTTGSQSVYLSAFLLSKPFSEFVS
ncbi:MAG: hypothetical protein V4672_06380 [Verrucomicrobiota bacterium]